MPMLEHGVYCWGYFADRAEVMAVAASVRAWTTGD